jgi:hypothetical protein
MLRINKLCLLFVFVVALVGVVFPLAQEGAICSDQLDTWTERTSGTTNALYGVTYGNGTFVAVGDDGTILTSPDGAGWTTRTSGITDYLSGVTYGNGTFVAVGNLIGFNPPHGSVLTSTDGVQWTERTFGFDYSSTIGTQKGVTFGNGTFVAVGISFISSTNGGVTWTNWLGVSGGSIYGVTYGNGTFVAVGDSGAIFTSPDGATWDRRSSGTSNYLSGVTYGYGFVAVGGGGTSLSSPDGITWTTRTSGTTKNLLGVTYDNGIFVAVGDDGTILTSTDGATWSTRTSGTTKKLYEVTYGNGTFVAVGDKGTILQSDPLGPPPEPDISVNPASINFGNVNVGSTPDQTTTVRNDGTGNLIIGSVTTPSLPFSKQSDTCSGQTLSPGATCIITYRFSPTSEGTFSSNSNIPSNDPDENPVTVSLMGTGVSLNFPDITVSPLSINFGSVNIGSSSNPQIITVRNDGTANLSIGSIALTGTNPSEFSKSIDACSGQILTPGGSCTSQIMFSPTSAGSKAATLSIPSNDPDENPVGVSLSGIGTTQQYTITITKSGAGTGLVTSNPAGINCGADCSEVYNQGTSVTLTPTPDSGSTFTGWSGACSGTGACIVSMTSDKTVTATFAQQQQEQNTLTVLKSGTGDGTVTSSPAGINCGSDCSETYSKVQKVKLTAKADANSSFNGWSGGGCSGKGTCTVTVNTQITVTATFDVKNSDILVSPDSLDFGRIKVGKSLTKTLKISNNGTGNLEITISGTEGTDFSIQGSSNLTIKPKKIYSLKVIFKPKSPGSKTTTLGLSSNDPDTPELNIELSGSTIEQPQQYTLTVTKAGTGSGTVASNPAGINCGADCSEAYNQGTTVTLTAAPDSGSTFTGWSGACSGAGTCTVNMTSDKTATATFAQQRYTLTVTKAGTGSGTVASNPAGINCGADCSEAYNQGTTVTLTAAPDSGSTFTGWSGACSGVGLCIINMTSDKAVTATFAQQQYTLTVTKAGTGSGTVASNPAGINCGADCSEAYNQGTSVTLTATPDSGSTFTGWSGACSGTGLCIINMTSDKAVTATFGVSYGGTWNGTTSQGKEFSLTVSNNGIASVTYGISCGSTELKATTNYSSPVQIIGNTFSLVSLVGIWDFITHTNQMHTVTINGTFGFPTSASGTIGISGSLCNASATWNATK